MRVKLLLQTGLLCLLIGTVAAQPRSTKISERSKQKSQAEAERVQLQQKLSALKQEIDRTETAKDNAVEALAQAEDAISAANRSLRELSQEKNDTEKKIAQLALEHKRLTGVVNAQQKQLAQLLRGQYMAGTEDRLKLLLSGDNPNRINRDLQYMGYLSKAQAKLLDTLRGNLTAIEANQEQMQDAKAEIEEIEGETKAQKTLLESEKAKRNALLEQLSKRLNAQRKEAGNLERDEKRLTSLVDKLSKLIEEQKKADALRREQAQKAAAEKRQNEKNVANANQKPATEKTATEHTAGIKNELLPSSEVQSASFAGLRGKLHLPVRGTISTKFGAKRQDGPNSKGLFIRAAQGSEIKAIAGGKVVFAEWLRGFGNLLIVDHGSQYLTIYGNNQTLFKRAGDAVKSGETIAHAGNSGSNDESGLYFEMRHQGRAFDPLGWVLVK